MERIKFDKKVLVCFVACFTIFFSVIKMQYYANNTTGFHDLPAHLGYLEYVHENRNEIIPNFKNMKIIDVHGKVQFKNLCVFNRNNEITFTKNDSMNYLGHPPLYYRIIDAFGTVRISDNNITFDMQKIALINMFIVGIGIALILYIGFLLNLTFMQYVFYAISSTSIPLITYLGCDLNNDNLGYIGVSLLVISMIKFNRNSRGYLTYFGISISLFICIMTKLTFGLFAVSVLMIYVIIYFIKNRNLSILINRKFAVTLPIYFLIAAYYISIYMRYSTFQPGLSNLDFEYFKTTGFYVAPENRVHMTFFKYVCHYINTLLLTWSDIRSHAFVRAHNLFEGIIYKLLIICPIIFIIINIKKIISKLGKDSLIILLCSFGVIIMMAVQFLNCYGSFVNDGYAGGMQGRYYIALTFIMSLGFIKLLDIKVMDKIFKSKKIIIQNIIYVILTLILLSSDFKYLIQYGGYI